MRAQNLGLTIIVSFYFFGTSSANGLPKVWLIFMGSDIQSLAIPAKGCDFFLNHAAGPASLEILYPHSKSRLNLEVLSLLPTAARIGSLANVRCVEYRSIGSKGVVIA